MARGYCPSPWAIHIRQRIGHDDRAMLPPRLPRLNLYTGASHRPADRPSAAADLDTCPPAAGRHLRALTLVEVMVAMSIMAGVMLGFIGTFIQSRRVTESSVLHAAATSMMYGIIEQIKQLDYTNLLPNYETDPFAPTGKTPPYFRVRLNQSTVVWLKVVHTPSPGTPQAPTTTPGPTVAAADIGAIDNYIGSIPLSTVTGTTSQQINLNIWVWIDEIPSGDASEVKKVTVVYTYSYLDGRVERIIRDREVIIRTRFDQ
jgi:type II secretory pathway pseudopilin PulG